MNLNKYTNEELSLMLSSRLINGIKVLKTSKKFPIDINLSETHYEELNLSNNQQIVEELRKREKAFYGIEDRRFNISEISDSQILQHSKAVSAIIDWRKLTDNGNGTTTLHGQTFKETFNLCDCEKYINQPVVAEGTAFLVDPSFAITAAHCIDENNIASYRLVFGFDTLPDQSTRTIIENANIVSGIKIIGRRFEDSTGIDWAIIQLDSPILHLEPLKCDFLTPVEVGHEVYCIGHPSGLPKKVALSGNVSSISDYYFTANIDTYAGNSGSPVINKETGLVQGILVRGEPNDFVWNGSCYESQRCIPNNCTGEDVMLINNLQHLIPSQDLPGVYFDPGAITVVDNRYLKLNDKINLDFKDKEVYLDIAIKTIQHYGFDFFGSINGNKNNFEYFLVNGSAPTGKCPYNNDELPFNRNKIEVRRFGPRWKIMSEHSLMLDFDQDQESARQALSIILRYKFNFQSFIGRPHSPLNYFRI